MAEPMSEGKGQQPDRSPIVEVASVSKRFGRVVALDDLSLDIFANEMFALLGPNGAGKTTLISILCTLLAPDKGTARIGGQDVVSHPRRAREKLGVVFQESSLDGKLTVEENLDFHARMYRMPRKLRLRRIDEMLELVELSDVRRRLVRVLSSGMKRRLEIARALIHESRVLILDEPTVGLDAQSRGRIWDYLTRIRAERGVTVVVTTHYIEEVDGCDRICIIDRGRILALDSPDALRTAYGQTVLRIRAEDEAAAGRILSRYPQATVTAAGEIRIIGAQNATVIDLLEHNGTDISDYSVERPTLNSVFLALTGRDLRDGSAPAGPRQAA